MISTEECGTTYLNAGLLNIGPELLGLRIENVTEVDQLLCVIFIVLFDFELLKALDFFLVRVGGLALVHCSAAGVWMLACGCRCVCVCVKARECESAGV